MFFGSGKKSKTWRINDTTKLLLTWRYSHLFWCPISYKEQWYIIGDSRSEDRMVDYEKVKELFPQNTPSLSLWQKYGFYFVFGAIIILVLVTS